MEGHRHSPGRAWFYNALDPVPRLRCTACIDTVQCAECRRAELVEGVDENLDTFHREFHECVADKLDADDMARLQAVIEQSQRVIDAEIEQDAHLRRLKRGVSSPLFPHRVSRLARVRRLLGL